MVVNHRPNVVDVNASSYWKNKLAIPITVVFSNTLEIIVHY